MIHKVCTLSYYGISRNKGRASAIYKRDKNTQEFKAFDVIDLDTAFLFQLKMGKKLLFLFKNRLRSCSTGSRFACEALLKPFLPP